MTPRTFPSRRVLYHVSMSAAPPSPSTTTTRSNRLVCRHAIPPRRLLHDGGSMTGRTSGNYGMRASSTAVASGGACCKKARGLWRHPLRSTRTGSGSRRRRKRTRGRAAAPAVGGPLGSGSARSRILGTGDGAHSWRRRSCASFVLD
ncbi:hypothetical protein GQ55_5G502800 [Panicum hallii var. hallii]|uniref:Uncharacterized protein n=1 Tax=Panicum hallii var. hallii TaxID=1504633 RepID=A0A2T7DS01_9POAL|nr:hypothetical protein GQ55_5G502800 [Panicum hallii var. hallii]